MNGRYFAGRRIEAYLFDGKERFKKSGPGQAHEDGEEAEEAEEKERLADFEKWLMAEGESN
jgi:HIV Tat-specific factor 1